MVMGDEEGMGGLRLGKNFAFWFWICFGFIREERKKKEWVVLVGCLGGFIFWF